MPFRPRRSAFAPLASFLVAAAAALAVACDSGRSIEPAATALAPTAKPSATYILPVGCNAITTNCGVVTSNTGPESEILKVCKMYPAGVSGPAVTMHVVIKPGNALRFGSLSDFLVEVQPNSCVKVWQNGEDIGPNSDLASVTEVVPNGYAASFSYVTVKRNGLRGDPASHDSTIAAPITGTGNSVTGLVIGGPYRPGAVVVFTNTPLLAALGDFVWNDANANGIQDASEAGIAGVTVTAVGPSGTLTTTTDAVGHYAFTGLTPGSYSVSVTAPGGYAASPTGQGSDPSTDSNVSGASVTLAAGATDNTIDFGFYQPGAIGDFVWNDLNANGVQDAGEPGIPGVTLTLKRGSTTLGTTTTDASGKYAFPNLAPGTYSVVPSAPAGYNVSATDQGANDAVDSDASGVSVAVASGTTNNDQDFGYYQLGSVGDFVWNDLNKNGVQDMGEPGIPGVTVTLAKGAVTQTTTTDANGKYLFANLAAGTYTVTLSGTPIGYVASPTDAGSNDALDSDGSGVSVAVAGTQNLTIDFGFYEKTGGAACTYTQGYWKTHEDKWPAPYSPTAPWMTPQKQVTDLTWDGLFDISPKGGNSYVQLAHQWMAAKLNRANGAPVSASVLSTLNAAEAWLLANTPTNGALPSIKNAQADAWMDALDTFNNGQAGTPHCD